MSILKLSIALERYRTISNIASGLMPAPISVDVPTLSDTFIRSTSATTNFNTNTSSPIGESNAGTNIDRVIIIPDWSAVPANHLIIAATLKMTPTADASSNARTMSAHRILKAVNITQATYTIASIGVPWDTLGARNTSTDYDGAIVLGSASVSAAPALNVADSFTMSLLPAEMQKFMDATYTNNGILLFVDTEVNDQIQYASQDHATVAFRPKITCSIVPL
jgi:hypothetical protein